MGKMHRGSSQLELEAAQYFELDMSQMNLCANPLDGSSTLDIDYSNQQTDCRNSLSCGCHHSQPDHERVHHHHHHHRHKQYQNMSGSQDSSRRVALPLPRDTNWKTASRTKKVEQNIRTSNKLASKGKSFREQRVKLMNLNSQNSNAASSRSHSSSGSKSIKLIESKNLTPDRRLNATASTKNGSPTTSTNSLPSISSSPSASPSIVCPHLSLDHLLEFRQDSKNVSPHTIGLCPRCRLDPPPNVHSPLSPMFKPFVYSQSTTAATKMNQSTGDLSSNGTTGTDSRPPMKLGNSDEQASGYMRSRSLSNVSGENAVRKRATMRDDSLDFALGPRELSRLQMSPTVRHSVVFIRRNSIESGRVLRIYKNGEPFEKPLRVCIMRGEFANIDHLLDHINTRLLVPLGARYLFHLDGQLVYSVEELKHGSIYIVSGTRAFDYRASKLLREQQEKEKHQQKAMGRSDQDPTSATRSNVSISRRNHQRESVTATTRSQAQPVTTSKGLESSTGSGLLARRVSNNSTPESKTCGELVQVDDGAARSYDSLNEAMELEERPARLPRAKSEMSALPKKLKKNVTFVDTGRGSSPAIGDIQLVAGGGNQITPGDDIGVQLVGELDGTVSEVALQAQARQKSETISKASSTFPICGEKQAQPCTMLNLKKELSTSSVGIQVSDTIDGFLIDLPVELPARGDDSNLGQGKRSTRRACPRANAKGIPSQGDSKKRRQFVTITERQLSLGEMNELKDLCQGDHHHETTLSETLEDAIASGTQEAEPNLEEPEVVPDRRQTISIGCDPQVVESTQTTSAREAVKMKPSGNNRLVTLSQAASSEEERREAQVDEHWHYPGGRAASLSTTERPVSQSGPNETVRARVTTPTPSLSRAGGAGARNDEISLSMSYDTNSLGDAQAAVVMPRPDMPMKLPPKRRIEVCGKLFAGLYQPSRNFRLRWVNGFSINDLYPENSVNEQQLLELETKNERSSPIATNGPLLTPQHSSRLAVISQPEDKAPSFMPSSRYHNWICHSRRHNELIYPAGSLIVLWCQWTNEQRYYAKHTSNVSAVALATLDLDLVASAQVCELYERPQISANIHLWSISELSTLMIIQDDQLRTKIIFSLRLKNSKSSGCELSVAARDEKQLQLFTFKRELASSSLRAKEEAFTGKSDGSSKCAVVSRDELATISLRVSKVTQSNQIPLFIVRVPSTGFKLGPNGKHQQVTAECEPLICFGRRCFQIWSPDVGQQKLRLMQAEGKSAMFTHLMSKATCLCRLSPSELLVGDADGNIALLATNLYTNNSLAATPKRTSTNSTSAHDARDLKYGLETIALLGPLASTSAPLESHGNAGKPHAGITSLARITGSLFMSADTSCAVRFWKIHQRVGKMQSSEGASIPPTKLSSVISAKGDAQIECEQRAIISLPLDLGFICTILLANYNHADSVVEFYIVYTSNTILFGSIKLRQSSGRRSLASASAQQELLANSSLSVVYEGHETSASSLVADTQLLTRAQMILNKSPKEFFYFTCSLDCRICKWNGKQLIWKSLLPSSCVSLAVHPTGFVLAVGSVDGTVYILDKISGLLISYFPLTPVRINCLAYSSDGSLLAAGCSNGSIFILPVYERGLKYKKVSIFQSTNAVVSLQFSVDNRYMLTSVTHGSFQELILWDLPNFRYMRDNVELVADKIRWFDSICSGSEDVRAIWENANLAAGQGQEDSSFQRISQKRSTALMSTTARTSKRGELRREIFVTNLSCHRLVKSEQQPGEVEPKEGNYVIASDTRGFLRLFRYPSYDIQQGFYGARISSSAVNCCRFLKVPSNNESDPDYFVSSSLDGSICLWELG